MTEPVIAYLAIQCVAPGAERPSDFLYIGAPSHKHPDARLVSPQFDCMQELFRWVNANGWVQQPWDPRHPVGVYKNTLNELLNGATT